MLYRNSELHIKDWIRCPESALLVTGARQVGKTFIIRKCLKELARDYIEINLIRNPELIPAIESCTSSQDLATALSLASGKKLTPKESYIFIDEVQEAKDIITKIKFWVEEGMFYFCLSGSLLGVELRNLRSAPVGYLEEIQMFPLDFEEFLYANSVHEELYFELQSCYLKQEAVQPYIHERMLELFRRYLTVGGMPAAVNEYINSGNMNEVMKIQKNIITQYKRDFTKYESVDKKLFLSNIYDTIPAQLLKQNRRFIFSDIDKKLKYERMENSFLWLTNAGAAIPVFNAASPTAPLKQSEKSNLFKLYLSDVGLLTALYGSSAKLKLLTNDTTLNRGGIYENAVAQELHAHGFPMHYYNSRKFGELDFVLERTGTVLPIEIKSGKTYYVHSAVNNVVNSADLNIGEAYVFADCNVKKMGRITYLPIYMVAFINSEVKLPTLKQIDF